MPSTSSGSLGLRWENVGLCKVPVGLDRLELDMGVSSVTYILS